MVRSPTRVIDFLDLFGHHVATQAAATGVANAIVGQRLCVKFYSPLEKFHDKCYHGDEQNRLLGAEQRFECER